ncbi:MAG: redox-sensing transcriptional repressor Rex [Clostridia bacterium]|nr:redox-sensing transcriptional repressor Rex [Clostridia bacterium]
MARVIKKSEKTISEAVINRLPRYFRFLSELKRAGVERTSSTELSELMGATASQIRQDLNCFGGFGQQGYGYSVPYLYDNIASILGVDKDYRAIIVGTGNLGRALASSPVFEKRGVHVCALFDVDADVIGKTFFGFRIKNMTELENYCEREKPDIAVLTVPRGAAKETAERLVAAGVKGIWNFTNIELAPGKAMVQNVHLGDTLMTLCYSISQNEGNKEDSEAEVAGEKV